MIFYFTLPKCTKFFSFVCVICFCLKKKNFFRLTFWFSIHGALTFSFSHHFHEIPPNFPFLFLPFLPVFISGWFSGTSFRKFLLSSRSIYQHHMFHSVYLIWVIQKKMNRSFGHSHLYVSLLTSNDVIHSLKTKHNKKKVKTKLNKSTK